MVRGDDNDDDDDNHRDDDNDDDDDNHDGVAPPDAPRDLRHDDSLRWRYCLD